MNCRDSESLILAERDGALTKNQLAGLSDHVAACPACRQLRTDLVAALDAYKADVAAITAPDADEAWRALRAKLHDTEDKSSRKRPLAPVIWFGATLAAAAALALAFHSAANSGSKLPVPGSETTAQVTPTPSTPSGELAITPPLYDPSTIAGADFVEAGDPNASTMVYVDKDSGWLVVWATDSEANTNG